MRADVVVVGAGFAGLSAAVALADAGLKVVVVEQSPRLGGRATAFTDRETGEHVDNGQHVLFGCYRETYAFLRRIGSGHLAPLQASLALTMAATDGQSFALRCPRLPPPWHIVGGVLGWRALSIGDRLSALRMRRLLGEARREGPEATAARVDPEVTVAGWLRAHGQSPRLCDWLWHPLAVAALNQSPDAAAAAPFVRVVAELCGPRVEDSSVGLPSVPLDQLYATPAKQFIEARGGTVLTGSPARVVMDGDAAVRGVRTEANEIAAAAVLSAVPWHAVGRLWDEGTPPVLAGLISRATAMKSSPIVTVNLWVDGPVLSTRFAGLVGGPMHWVFDKAAIFGRAAGHLSVVASGAEELASMDNARVTQTAVEHLQAALPEMRGRRLVRSVVVREHRATFSLAPGGPARPAAATDVDRFFLAGDWTDTGLPATIEGAVKSGRVAAALIVERLRAARRTRGS